MAGPVAFKTIPKIFTVQIRSQRPYFWQYPVNMASVPRQTIGQLARQSPSPYDKWLVETNGTRKLTDFMMFKGQFTYGGYLMTTPTNCRFF
jgi:hypothetical protein